jgi:hypothetical protein
MKVEIRENAVAIPNDRPPFMDIDAESGKPH